MKLLVGLASAVVIAACGSGQTGPTQPATPTASALVAAMTEAHGGNDAWQRAGSVRFRHLVTVPNDTPWISDEVHEPGIGGRSYHDWPVDRARLGFDGERIWTVNWSRGNPPTMMARFIYYFLALPWIVGEPGVELDEVGRAELPDDPTSYRVVGLRFDAGGAKHPPTASRFLLYIHPKTHRLRAVDFWVSFGPLLDLMQLPADATEVGPLRHIFTEHVTVDGLVVPSRFTTFGPDGSAYGDHVLTRWSFSLPFDSAKTARPEGAVVDDGSAARGSSTFPWRARAEQLESARAEAHLLAAKVVVAHGGASAWRAAPTISFEHELEFPGIDKPWVSRETVENSPTRRLYHDYPNQGGQLTWDGTDVWSVDWKLGNPPRIQPFLSLYSLITPFLTLDPLVALEATGTGRLPKDETDYLTLTVRPVFDSKRPPTAGYYTMYIDPETFRMKGVAYNVVFGHMLDLMELPPEAVEMGPMTHVFDEMAMVDGIVVPVRYWTQGPGGGVAGTHVVRDWSFRKQFDESRMQRPANAVVDSSPHQRKTR